MRAGVEEKHLRSCIGQYGLSLSILVFCVSLSGILLPGNINDSIYAENPDYGMLQQHNSWGDMIGLLAAGSLALLLFWGVIALFGKNQCRFPRAYRTFLAIAGLLWCSAAFRLAYSFNLSIYAEPFCPFFASYPASGAIQFDGGCLWEAHILGPAFLIGQTSIALLLALLLRLVPDRK